LPFRRAVASYGIDVMDAAEAAFVAVQIVTERR